ncbi:MAG: hypothetical protein AABZ55_11160 [Bdellovibrionota bacterium]
MKARVIAIIGAGILGCTSCSSVKTALALNSSERGESKPIHNPFGDFYAKGNSGANNQNIILRTKKGDRSVEVELPGGNRDMSDFSIPMSPAFKDEREAAAGIDERYRGKTPTIADREIASTFPANTEADEQKRREIENELGLVPEQDKTPEREGSYLAALDHVKQLYRNQRYEAALIEVEEVIRSYPTDPKLYEMRGTLLERLGRGELAMRSWSQALRLNPKNEALKKFLTRKRQIASVPQ